jgi:hypothetical protein
MLELERRRRAAHDEFLAKVDNARAELRDIESAINTELRSLAQEAGSLQVLVRRTPGPNVTLYHSAVYPCGRVTGQGRSRTGFEPTSERVARLRGLSRCTACGWWRHEQAEGQTG